MPCATNALDGARIYFEADEVDGPPVVFHGGLLDSVDLLQTSPIARSLPAPEFRPVFVDHRGLGRSEKPHDVEAYAMPIRVADAIAVLDELGVERAHFIGLSWGGRLGFGIGEHAPERVLSLVTGGQQPYAMDPDGPLVRAATAGLEAACERGIEAFVAALEQFSGVRFPEVQRRLHLDNDPVALAAAWHAALAEGAIAADLRAWRIRCLVFVGAEDVDFHDQARRAAGEIPDAEFVELAGLNHLGAHLAQDRVLPAILRILRTTG
jgi:pimeloyl-ACP methyl ester carboxylesterase